eukprot:Skav213240  [mRNA]  locus=scaffold2594:6288:7214:- [translate_table: standard]
MEVDSRIATKEFFNGFASNPLEHFKLRISEQFPPVKSLSVYGFRKIIVSKDAHTLQVIARVPTALRLQFLTRSGIGELLVRDYVPKDEDPPSDVSVVPRFFEISRVGKDTILRACSDNKGWAGIVSTKRGLAVRALSASIEHVRVALLPNDPRLTDLNRSVAPRLVYNCYGWPPGINPQEVVKSLHHATGLGAVPTRCSRANGVICWTVGFAECPEVLKSLPLHSISQHVRLSLYPHRKICPCPRSKRSSSPKPTKNLRKKHLLHPSLMTPGLLCLKHEWLRLRKGKMAWNRNWTRDSTRFRASFGRF